MPLFTTRPALTSVGALLAAIACLALAGCGGSSPDRSATVAPAATTAATTPAETPGQTPATTTTGSRPTTLSAVQKARLGRASQRLVAAAATFLADINRCIPSGRRSRCVRRAVDPAERTIARSRTTISTLATSVQGGCALQLSDLRGKVSDVTDVLGPMAQAVQKRSLKQTTTLGLQAQAALRSFATSSQIVDRAC